MKQAKHKWKYLGLHGMPRWIRSIGISYNPKQINNPYARVDINFWWFYIAWEYV